MNHTTRSFPRTLEQAFGPYQRGGIYEPAPSYDRSDRIVMIACALVGMFTLGLLVGQ